MENTQDWEKILTEIVYRNWKQGDEIGLFSETKTLIHSLLTSRDEMWRKKIEKKKFFYSGDGNIPIREALQELLNQE